MVMNFARRQRSQLLGLMHETGPFAETACVGWQTQDLAAHLWIREHKLSALPGIGIERFAKRTERLQQEALHSKGFEVLLAELQEPGLLVRPIDPIVGGVEWYIHHEDVRRPRGEKVQLTEKETRALEPVAMAMAKKTQLGSQYTLVVASKGGRVRRFGKGPKTVRIEGTANELLLHFSGRPADVLLKGDDVDGYLAAIKGL